MDIEFVDRTNPSYDTINSINLGMYHKRNGYTKSQVFAMNVDTYREAYIQERDSALEAKTDYYSAKLIGNIQKQNIAKVRCWKHHNKATELLNKLYNYKMSGRYEI